MTPALYQLIPPKTLEALFTSFSACTQLPVQVLDPQGIPLIILGEEASFCKTFQSQLSQGEDCQTTHALASQQACCLGESQLFPCHANLNHLIYPLRQGETLYGTVLLGPFLPDPADRSLLSHIAQSYPISTPTLLELYDKTSELQVVTEETQEQLKTLLRFLLAPYLQRGGGAVLVESQEEDPNSARDPRKPQTKPQEAVDQALRYLQAHFRENISLEDVASHVHLNPTYFSTLFKQQVHRSFRDQLNALRIQESQRLLRETSNSIIEIASAVGFPDQSYFSKVFKKRTGQTPKEYRQG